MNIKEVIKPAAILFVICVAVSAALAGTNLLTADRIARAAAQKAEESRMVVLPEAEAFQEKEGEDGTHYIGLSKEAPEGVVVGYVFETESKGYGGTVKVMTGINTEGNITGVIVLSHSETPGLGANAEKETFRDQYQQPVANLTGGIQVVKFQAPAEGEIQAMTGATITSTAVTNAVNLAIEQYQNAYASEGGN
ncbi:MAG: RnfABCDGE type electron transport complex subunit G [Acutalibacter sp.]|jgi:electron transport complex protein RnfG|nr:RnfABCDGE type electron transport complex subunit G [Acutalibacter sp.]